MKKREDPSQPVKPSSAVALFFKDTQAKVKAQNPNATFEELLQIMFSTWDELGVEQKQRYKRRKKRAKEKYMKQLTAYRASLVSQSPPSQASRPGLSPNLHQIQPQLQALSSRGTVPRADVPHQRGLSLSSVAAASTPPLQISLPLHSQAHLGGLHSPHHQQPSGHAMGMTHHPAMTQEIHKMDESRSTDENSPEGLNCCHLMDPEDSFSSLPTFVPETPRRRLRKRSRPCSLTEQFIAEAVVGSPLPAVSGGKRRRLSLRRANTTLTDGRLAVRERPSSDSLSFLTPEERRWLNSENNPTESIGDYIVISDDEEARESSQQLREDEALARLLQIRFNVEQLEETHRLRQQNSHMVFPQPEPRFFPFVAPLVDFPEDIFGHHSQREQRWMGNDHLDLSDNHQGHDYEALLELEEHQGAVVSRKLTREQIERFPSKNFQSSAADGRTQCQICICDYSDGEKLRTLPCFHDYHVKCIDRWLKDNLTCPICRVNLTDVSL
ncbi:uncharacterized protein LOC114465396 [Gouania willdenowi]|uniref:Uncharacterized LOC114465396 n=1 Tax=Gouania willdenowi TaxID=441366 RepID=A0A8C5ER79_GOUWI|nr:uncharacterized protein LOC114465396 [Gouania willdenowi]